MRIGVVGGGRCDGGGRLVVRGINLIDWIRLLDFPRSKCDQKYLSPKSGPHSNPNVFDIILYFTF